MKIKVTKVEEKEGKKGKFYVLTTNEGEFCVSPARIKWAELIKEGDVLEVEANVFGKSQWLSKAERIISTDEKEENGICDEIKEDVKKEGKPDWDKINGRKEEKIDESVCKNNTAKEMSALIKVGKIEKLQINDNSYMETLYKIRKLIYEGYRNLGKDEEIPF